VCVRVHGSLECPSSCQLTSVETDRRSDCPCLSVSGYYGKKKHLQEVHFSRAEVLVNPAKQRLGKRQNMTGRTCGAKLPISIRFHLSGNSTSHIQVYRNAFKHLFTHTHTHTPHSGVTKAFPSNFSVCLAVLTNSSERRFQWYSVPTMLRVLGNLKLSLYKTRTLLMEEAFAHRVWYNLYNVQNSEVYLQFVKNN
jgi:hypothetical protein